VSDRDDIADVLAQVVDVGPSAREADLADAVSRHVSNRPGPSGGSPDEGTVAALRALATTDPVRVVGDGAGLHIEVDFNDLLADVGEPDVWTILGKLKDLFGATT
jgi:hypothetical protein